jgi:hypothetical protein
MRNRRPAGRCARIPRRWRARRARGRAAAAASAPATPRTGGLATLTRSPRVAAAGRAQLSVVAAAPRDAEPGLMARCVRARRGAARRCAPAAAGQMPQRSHTRASPPLT